ncbi:helix-turn-helix domain-containing protein [Xylanibacillus composti]|uniref:XRE family transcriptional regulator n=1 Tax=Xylanibacillus composti TaxID=1572762 RepID=A0A8J4H856_9BACL|nr:helix-turn-helix domain-containing protein [Xylanibacillus composti]MDT9727153.1 helix-turn-helix domain-containing protein [Xylanibacillus composti]GIQ70658.1 XRE family transcriptional regulator [Xylanibacillus composti]
MDSVKIGKLIAKLRKEKKLTQKNIADALGIQNKTVSKWECGLGCPDLSLWPELSAILGVDMKQMMEGEITSNQPDSGNIDKVRFYVCSSCGNILVSTGSASIFCCGRQLERILPMGPPAATKITVEEMDTDYFITFDHPMTKEHYISFVAFVKSDRVLLNRLYPEQSPTCRIPVNTGGKLYVYCIKHGLSVYSDISRAEL